MVNNAQQLSLFKVEYNEEIRNRIRLSVAAYAYEYENTSIMSDAEFDRISYLILPEVKTGKIKLDNFFKKHFEPATGMWVRKHPNKKGLKSIYEKYHNEGGEFYHSGCWRTSL